jgi:hypothetical protein
MSVKSPFSLFLEQKDLFITAIQDYDYKVWIQPIHGNYKQDNPHNWFFGFVPSSWGRYDKTYGVHVALLYAIPLKNRPESFRLTIGVESPLKYVYRQKFKEDVIYKTKTEGIAQKGFTLQARDRTKLLEADLIPFNDQSWRIAFDRYTAIQPIVDIVAETIRAYNQCGAFEGEIKYVSE